MTNTDFGFLRRAHYWLRNFDTDVITQHEPFPVSLPCKLKSSRQEGYLFKTYWKKCELLKMAWNNWIVDHSVAKRFFLNSVGCSNKISLLKLGIKIKPSVMHFWSVIQQNLLVMQLLCQSRTRVFGIVSCESSDVATSRQWQRQRSRITAGRAFLNFTYRLSHHLHRT